MVHLVDVVRKPVEEGVGDKLGKEQAGNIKVGEIYLDKKIVILRRNIGKIYGTRKKTPEHQVS